MTDINLFLLILISGCVGAAAGYLGSFMVLKRMSLVGDALSHVALPGMAIAIAFNFSPMAGAFLALAIAVVGIWYFEETSNQYPEALVGISFTASLALGILITPEPDLLEALFGSIEKITFTEGAVALILSAIIIVLTGKLAKGLLLGVISKDLAKSAGVPVNKLNLLYLLLVGGVVALGVRFVGTLLTGALVIIPAASAKNVSRSMHTYHFLAIFFGITSAVIGIMIHKLFNVQSGLL